MQQHLGSLAIRLNAAEAAAAAGAWEQHEQAKQSKRSDCQQVKRGHVTQAGARHRSVEQPNLQ
jgi:hypothetical protein